MVVTSDRKAQARELLAQQQELLTAGILGDLLDYGEADYLLALVTAMQERDKWASEHPDEYRRRREKRHALKALAEVTR